MEDYKKLLTDLYTINDPERIKQIDYFLTRYKGKEKQFYISQQAKYKSKKPISDSKKIIEEALARIKAQSADKAKANTNKTENPKVSKVTAEKTPQKIVEPPKVVKAEKPIAPVIKKEPAKKIIEESKSIASPIKEEKKVVEAVKPDTKKAEPIQKPIKKEVWFNDKPKKSVPEPQRVQAAAPPFKTDKHFNKKYFLYIFGSVLLVIILVVIVFFVFFYSPSKKEITAEKPKTTITKKTVKAEPKKTTTTPAKEKITQQTPKPTVKASPKKQAPINLGGVYIKKGDLNLPAYFVACSAVKNESLALKKVSELKASGFDASYYWIPDFVTRGNPYFKVVIGPFTTRMDAMRKLTPVQERAEFDAYVLELK